MRHYIISHIKQNHKWLALLISKIYSIFLYPRNICASLFITTSSIKVRFFNHTKNKFSNHKEFLEEIITGDVFIVKNLINIAGVNNSLNSFFEKNFDHKFSELDNIHLHKDPIKLSSLVDKYSHSLYLLRIQNRLLKKLFSFSKNLYVELMPNLRPHLPKETISLKQEIKIEKKIGKGKLNSHGPHKDSWRYHPKNTLNVWLALTKINAKNGLFVLPKSNEYYPYIKNNEIREDCDIHSKDHFLTSLDIGDAVIFLAENLHGSILNQTNETRFALSMRCSLERPDFHNDFIYNYVQVKPFFSNLTIKKLFPRSVFTPPQRDISSSLHYPTKKLPIIKVDNEFMYLKIKNRTCKYRKFCKHKGADMTKGYIKNNKLYCKMHHLEAEEI